MAPLPSGANLVGSRRSIDGVDQFRAFDAANAEPTGIWYSDATSFEIEEAGRLAAAASTDFGLRSGPVRAELLRAIASGIEALGEPLIKVLMLETGLGHDRLEAEKGRTVGQLRLFADLVNDGSWVDAVLDAGSLLTTPPRPDLRRVLQPVGPVAVFGASNFPLAFSVAGGDTASALAAGCPVVFKAHPGHPGGSSLVAGVVHDAVAGLGLPAGIFSMLHGLDHGVGAALVLNEHVEAVAFTGSFEGGMALNRLVQQRRRPIPLFAEMGSINPVILFPSALGNNATETIRLLAASLTLGTGQFCTNPGLIIALGPVADEFGAAFDNSNAGTMLSPMIGAGYVSSVEKVSSRHGVRRLTSVVAAGVPTVLAAAPHVFIADRSLQGEMFGPATLVVEVADVEELVRVIEALDGQLTGTIHASVEELRDSSAVVHALSRKVGRLLFGGVPTGVAVSPAQHHGGPYPATSDGRSTSVGTHAIERFARPIAYQDFPDELLPPALQAANPLRIQRHIVDAAPAIER